MGSKRTFTDEHKANIAAARTGKHHTEETKRKISETRKGNVYSDEYKKLLSAAMLEIRKKLEGEGKSVYK